MSFGSFIKYGTGFGSVGGLVAGTYFYRDAKRYYSMSEKFESESDLRYMAAFRLYNASRKAALNALVIGPFAGMSSGITLYGAKRATIGFLFAEAKTQKIVLIFLGIVTAAMVGKKVAD